MSEQAIELKGSLFTLSVLHLAQNDFPRLKLALKAKIEQAPGFFYRAPIVVNIEKLDEQIIDFKQLSDIVSEMDLVLVGICGGTTEQKQSAKENQLAVLSYGKDAPQAAKPIQVERRVVEATVEATVEPIIERRVEVVEKVVYEPAMEVRQNIRSGQQVYAKDTDLIVLGSVGHGAEVIADGNIHVYGTLRGRAIAGAKGDKNAKIYCQNLRAELVSISGNYMMSEALQAQLWDQPANISLAEEKIVVSELN
jgi:septum site-determining protein MinC